MKTVNKLFVLIIGFAAGTLSGAFLRFGFDTLLHRNGAVGGEILIIPLFAMLIYCGYIVGKELSAARHSHRSSPGCRKTSQR